MFAEKAKSILLVFPESWCIYIWIELREDSSVGSNLEDEGDALVQLPPALSSGSVEIQPSVYHLNKA